MPYTGQLQMFRGVPLDIGGEDTFYFPDRDSQNAYFDGLVESLLTFNARDYKFIREGYVSVGRPHDYLQNCNYLRFKNQDLNGALMIAEKWYYAFITKIEYINDNVTGVYFTIDVLQTWLPHIDYNLNECFIERMHSESDGVGANLATETVRAYKNKNYEESLYDIMDEGFYVGVLFTYQDALFDNFKIADTAPDESGYRYSAELGTQMMDGTVSGANLVLFKGDDDGIDEMRKAIKQTTNASWNDKDYINVEKVLALYMIPAKLINEDILPTLGAGDTFWKWKGKTIPTYRYISGQPHEPLSTGLKSAVFTPNFELLKIGTYEPKNAKLLTSQYTNYEVTNVEGNTATLEPEGFVRETGGSESRIIPHFTFISSSLPPQKIGVKCLSYPTDKYYGTKLANDQMFQIGELPGVSLSISTYRDWLVKQTLQKIQAVAPVAFTAASGYASFVSGLEAERKIFDQAQVYGYKMPRGFVEMMYGNELGEARGKQNRAANDVRQSEAKTALNFANDVVTTPRPVPISAGNGNDMGSALMANNLFKLSFKKVAPVEEELVRIDNYFTAYGYAQNAIKMPHVKLRNRFTYIKTKGARNTPKFSSTNDAGIPAEYMSEINACYNAGIRFWVGQNISDLTSANNVIPSNEWDN